MSTRTNQDIGDVVEGLSTRVYNIEQRTTTPSNVDSGNEFDEIIIGPDGNQVIVSRRVDPPTTLSLTPGVFQDTSYVDIAWTPPTSGEYTRFHVYVAEKQPDNSFILQDTFSTPDSEMRVSGLTPNTTYGIRVVSVNRIGDRSSSLPAAPAWEEFVALRDTNPPPQVTGVAAYASIKSVIVEWEESTATDVALFEGLYEVQADRASTFDSKSLGVPDFQQRVAATIASFSGLLPDTEYFVRVRAIDSSANEGPWSVVQSAITGLVTNVDLGPGSVHDTNIQSNAVTTAKIAAGAVDTGKLATAAVDSTKLADGSVLSTKLANLSVTLAKIADGAVGSAKVADGAVLETKLAASSVVGSKIAAGAIDAGHISAGVISTKHLVVGELYKGDVLDDPEFETSKWAGARPHGWSGWGTQGPAKETATTRWGGAAARWNIAVDVDGGITRTMPFPYGEVDAVEVDIDWQLVTGGISGAGLIVDWVRADGTYDRTLVKLGDEVPSPSLGKWYSSRVTVPRPDTMGSGGLDQMRFYLMASWTGFGARNAKDIIYDRVRVRPANQTGALTELWRYPGSVLINGGDIYANTVTANAIAAGTITAAEISANAVTASELAAGAVLAEHITAGEVVAGKLAAGAVTAGDIAAGAVTAGTIAADVVTATEIAAGAVTATEIAADAVVASKISASAVTAIKIAADAVVADKIAASAVTTIKLAADAVTAAKIAANTITAAEIAAGTITATQLSALTMETGQYIQSSNYVAGDAGFRLNADGTGEFSTAITMGNGAKMGQITAGHYGFSLDGSLNNAFFRRASDGNLYFRMNYGGATALYATYNNTAGTMSLVIKGGSLTSSSLSTGNPAGLGIDVAGSKVTLRDGFGADAGWLEVDANDYTVRLYAVGALHLSENGGASISMDDGVVTIADGSLNPGIDIVAALYVTSSVTASSFYAGTDGSIIGSARIWTGGTGSQTAPAYTFNYPGQTSHGMYSNANGPILTNGTWRVYCDGSTVRLNAALNVEGGRIHTNPGFGHDSIHWYINTERSWDIRQNGSGASTNLELKSHAGGKSLIIVEAGANDSTTFMFQADHGYFHAIRLLPLTDNAYHVGDSSRRWRAIWATDTTINSSDLEAKDDLADSDLGLGFIEALRPRRYRWKDGARPHYGLVAQEVKQALDSIGAGDFAGYVNPAVGEMRNDPDDCPYHQDPELIQDCEEWHRHQNWLRTTNTLGLRYGEFIGPLIAAVQELSERVKVLEGRPLPNVP